jgi:hypothetical protein
MYRAKVYSKQLQVVRFVCLTVLVLNLVGCSAANQEPVPTTTSETQPVIYTGCCDASAGGALTADLFVVANDEDNVLRVYRRGEGGGPVNTFDMSRFMEVEVDEPEGDLEGAARSGDRIYWITSHGRNKNGKDRPSRRRFFVTRVEERGEEVRLVPEGSPYKRLLQDLIDDPRLEKFGMETASRRAPKDRGALNIEGLAVTPEDELLIGFRNPIPGGEALVVPLLNPAEVVEGKRAELGDPILLDLAGLGVRSLEFWQGQYYIVAGSRNGDEEAIQLYEWSGPGSKPKRLDWQPPQDTNPEALFFYEDQPMQAHLLSDDGSLEFDGQECKDLKDARDRRFRRFRVTLSKP